MRKSGKVLLAFAVLFFGGLILSGEGFAWGDAIGMTGLFVGLPVWFAIRSSERGKPRTWPYVIAVFFAAVIVSMYLPEKTAVEVVAQQPTPAMTVEPTRTPEPTSTPTATPTPEPTATPAPGESRETAYVLTVDEFVKEIKKNKKAAAEKYNGKYVELTGKITDISVIGDSITGYYVYGKRLGKGLNITCWVYDSISLDLFTGKKATFQGIVREITTVHNTELGECVIIK